MRLTHIKLAGFKSFVDPTVIPVPAQLTGVVGPNGCGKSNVIDAVRWVLGESSAKHLRGESMQDVIFNGSGTRKPASRASVELAFDNAQGRAGGQWSQYGEIAVKRVLDRSGDSTYFINNLKVRRRDVADVFLGTGVGARAYAIIEQGMIARLIEARPEELRGYLEEAAGVSKYKERRRETETRLRDARDNLNRVEDVRQELDRQVEQLAAQAEVAARYQVLQSELTQAQQRLWYARKRDAESARARIAQSLTETQLQLDAETARLRQIEAGLEHQRQTQLAGQDAVTAAQARFYEAQAEVARIEQAKAHRQATHERLLRQLAELDQRQSSQRERLAANQTALTEAAQQLPALQLAKAAADAAVGEASDTALPQKDDALKRAQQAVGEAQRSLNGIEQARQVDETRLAATRRQLEQLDARQRRLAQERAQLPRTDAAGLTTRQLEVETLADSLRAAQTTLAEAEAALPGLDTARTTAAQALDTCRHTCAGVDAERAALSKLQHSLQADGELANWLAQHPFADAARVWQQIRVEPGWEAAVEAVLRERLQALAASPSADLFAAPPPARLTLWQAGAPQGGSSQEGASGLAAWVTADDPALQAVLAEWLTGVEAVDSDAEACARQATLQPGAHLVTRAGHVFTRSSVSFHGASTAAASMLARSRDIERLTQESERLHHVLTDLDAQHAHALIVYTTGQRALQDARVQATQLQNRHHTAQMEWLRLQQAVERVQARSTQITSELDEVETLRATEAASQDAIQGRLAHARHDADAARDALYAARQTRDQADRAVFDAREWQRAAERRQQEAGFALHVCRARHDELVAQGAQIDAELAADGVRLSEVRHELAQLADPAADAELQAALGVKSQAEAGLGAARHALEDETARLRLQDETRLACESGLEPRRRTLESLRLKDQEAMLGQAQFELQLREAAADELKLATDLANAPPPAQLQAQIAHAQRAMAALGAVNLAALEALTDARTRSDYLGAQSADLLEAVTTLEDAIHKIDQESRARLKATFDTVNLHLGELFPQLFGGGQARLILTGEELLDSGVAMFAQPPGKKNASIQLLSGGEKALTALSLVFAMFKLNPAPFCLLDEVDAPLDDANTDRYCNLVRAMSAQTQFLFITHNRVTMAMAQHLAGVTMQEPGVSRIVAVDVEAAVALTADSLCGRVPVMIRRESAA